jgi:hypothetical protein
LSLGDNMQGEGGLAAPFGAEDLDGAAPWDAADAKGQVEGQSARGDRGYPLWLLVAHAHDGALSKLPLYLRDGGVYSLALVQCILQKGSCIDNKDRFITDYTGRIEQTNKQILKRFVKAIFDYAALVPRAPDAPLRNLRTRIV